MALEGQVAMVTGGGQGIGKAIALRFAREGADIAVVDVNRGTAEATAAESAISAAPLRSISPTTASP
jgi:meso-butanediol dehydrogenase/(S,S)-butanediol dehydrogenase/diacetyl reductase